MAKIVLTGGTGFVGAQVLDQLLAHPEVETVTCLTRRPLSARSPKLETVIHADFTVYDEPLLARLADHEACIWALGGKMSDASSLAEYERTTHTTTVAFARALSTPASAFRFCYLSGMGVDPSESSKLRWERETRFLKGRTERDLSALGDAQPAFSPFFFRPGGILADRTIVEWLLAPIVVRVETLARAMIRVALTGAAERVIGNARIKALAA